MFSKIANFFIQNSKLTLVLVMVSLIVGIGSYFKIPKQYNPTIVVPAFQIEIPANGLSAEEVKRHITTPFENLIMELEGIDEVFSYSYDNYAGIMAKFQVGVNNEYAKVRLNQKVGENLKLKPLGIGMPNIRSIDPEELPQITYAINYVGEDILSEQEIQIYLKQIAHLIKEDIKTLENISTMEIVGGAKNDIIIEIDLDKTIARNTDILQVYEVLKNYNLNMPSGDIVSNNNRVFVGVEGKVNKVDEIKKIVISNIGSSPLYLEDIAEIRRGTKRLDSHVIHTTGSNKGESVLLGFGKQKGTNAVFVTNDIIAKMEEIEKYLPKDIELVIIQNEGETAKDATNMLLINLFQSVIIVFIILAFYLGIRDAFNTAISIPLTLSLVFLISLIIGDNINKITLFALILVLGMIVDNSTVVVENISRHLKERGNSGESRLNAVLNGVQEVGVGVIMATITRLIAFGSMFAVGGLMGEYMGPIPKYAIIALVLSLIISLTINPWMSYLGTKDEIIVKKEVKKKLKFDPRNIYLSFMKKFINKDKKGKLSRKSFKIVFWLTFVAIIIGPIYAGVFKSRMLPKSDQNQIYVWIDANRDASINKMLEIEEHMSNFFIGNENLPSELDIVENITSSIGQAFMGDFSNLFRGGSNRIFEHQISSRVNLIPKNKFEGKRITSENYTIEIRDMFREHMLEVYPDLQIRLLEDPPGPPVMSTFLINIKGNASRENLDNFMIHTQNTVQSIAKEYSLEDLGNSKTSTYRKININIDNARASSAGITTTQITNTLGIIFSGVNTGIIRNNEAFTPTNLVLTVKDEQKQSIEDLKNIYLTNSDGKKIPLDSIADFEYTFVHPEIITDKRQEVRTIYAEMGNESLIYPVFKLYGLFRSDSFLGDDYVVDNWNPYRIEYIGLKDGKRYIIEWSGEWKLAIDTYKDMGFAMFLSILAIYFLLVGQFASFGIAGIIMITFLLGFFGIFPGFSLLYLINGEYFSSTSMIGVIALAGIVVGNAIILVEYLSTLKKRGMEIEEAVLKAGFVRFAPIILTSLTTIFGASTIIGDPVWSGLAWAIIWGLLLSSFLTLIVVPIFYYDSQKKEWDKYIEKINSKS